MASTTPSLNGHIPSEEEYLQYMEIVAGHSAATFFLFRVDHCRYFGGDANPAVVLAYLLNQLRMKDSNDRDRESLRHHMLWFRCPAKGIQDTLGMSDDRQIRAVKVLVEKKIVETDHRLGNVLWVRVNAERLTKIARRDARLRRKPGNPGTGNRETREPETGKPENPYTNKPTKKPPLRGAAPLNGLSSVPKKTCPPFCLEAQAEFKKLLRESGHPPVYGRSRTGWTPEQGAEQISQLLRFLGGDEARLRKTLRYYPPNADKIAAKGGPRSVFSIKTFCHPEMFMGLERFRLKEQGPDRNSMIESIEDLGNGRTRTRLRIQEEERPANVEDLGNGRTRTRFKVDA